MNIFYLSSDVKKCAQWHVDKHIVKMPLETAQLLSTAHRVIDGTSQTITVPRKKTVWLLPDDRQTVLYAATHVNHPSAIWSRQTDANYLWLYRLFVSLLAEYTHRYGKIHGCAKLLPPLSILPRHIPRGAFVEPPLAMPDNCKRKTAIESYHEYYRVHKQSFASWKHRETPEFMRVSSNGRTVAFQATNDRFESDYPLSK